MGVAVRNIMPQRGSQLGIGMNQHAVGGLLTFPGYWKMCRGTRAGVKALRPRSGALQRGLDSGPASAMLCLSGECHLLLYPAEHISAKLTGKRPLVSSRSLCAPSIT